MAQLEVITLNCWGLKYISKLTTERIQHIAEELAHSQCDVVCLQEIWQWEHWEHIRNRLEDRLPHAKYYWSGVMGSGLAILSKFPIVQTDMRPYTLNGRPQAFFRGDWYVGKGIASAIIALPDGRQCQVFNTHMHAPYNEAIDTYLCHRTAQGWDMRKILLASVQAGYITFATGDFNSIPGSLVHRFLTTYLSDSFVTLHPELPLVPRDIVSMNAWDLVEKYGVTCDVSPLNTWRAQQAPGMEPKRLDYMFHDDRAVPKVVEVVFTGLVRNVNCSPSDHFGLRCVFSLQPQSTKKTNRKLHLEDYDEIRKMLDWYRTREQTHSFRRIIHFWFSLGCIVVILSLMMQQRRPFAQVLLGLLLLLSGIAAVLQGLLGAIFGWWELRNLQEFEDEIIRAQKLHEVSGT
ncbi:Putative neutral sphingomyelinase [Taphrina deformans PYCC 5710]|uniref:Neutral sphingomyelinase n=1 Tax=Taphrina deformans (strain PYCC 5710 / ATCC 11124 / CBS 356.35 / IMI 108563 / JCM 9778 / NBRC 8474) TaxID=1097556 RepID=R4XFZ0_TAPDE|nr:Putative neutral sphingomyelinase [Taphrina deformans PYCC 5710]|eukprot:CCG83414.1 Putative neutral sphingomyelinase [Taphrina deformans PYCC 5710]